MVLECIVGLIEISVLGVMVAQRPPNPLGVGSSPTGRVGVVAQLVRALDCHSRGRGFDPRPSRFNGGYYCGT